MTKYKKGKIVKATVSGIESYGVFVTLDDYYSGLIYISEISHGFVKNIHDYVDIGEDIFVKVIGVDESQNHLILSIKGIEYKKLSRQQKKKIKETSLGFKTLEYKLPIWIEKELKKQEKITNCIDK